MQILEACRRGDHGQGSHGEIMGEVREGDGHVR
jgi:hypothetical protein